MKNYLHTHVFIDTVIFRNRVALFVFIINISKATQFRVFNDINVTKADYNNDI